MVFKVYRTIVNNPSKNLLEFEQILKFTRFRAVTLLGAEKSEQTQLFNVGGIGVSMFSSFLSAKMLSF